MHKDRLLGLTPPALAGLLWMLAPAAVAQHAHSGAAEPAPREQRLKTDKKGEVQLRVETRIGDFRLKPGRYRVQHRVEGSEHFVYFTEAAAEDRGSKGGGVPELQTRPVAIKCRVTPAETRDSATVFTAQDGLGALLTHVLIETTIDCR